MGIAVGPVHWRLFTKPGLVYSRLGAGLGGDEVDEG